ncbi:MAG: hypothetical protein IJU87_01185 [Lachnospiraceae bacterium]|nr:hypothetical protein [Lachnospiraceae bacterium]
MSIRKTLLLLTLNYILIFAWMFMYRLGEMSALLIFPITMGVAFLDTVFAEGRKSAYLWCGNLLIATIVGILLQAYLYIRATGDMERAVLRAAVEILAAVLIIGMIAVISGHEAAKLKKRRIEKSMRSASYPGRASLFPDSEDEENKGKEKGSGWGAGYGNMGSSFDDQSDEELYDEEDPDEDDEEEDEDNEPTFRVIKKS